jgi:hypothetical protein
MNKFEAISLNGITVQRRVSDSSEDAEAQLSVIFNKCAYYSLNVQKSMDITSTVHIFVFSRGVTADFEVFEELVDLHSMQGQTKGSDYVQALLCSL